MWSDNNLPRRARDSHPKNEGKIENIIPCANVCEETLTGVGDVSRGSLPSQKLSLPCKLERATESNNHETALQWYNLSSATSFAGAAKQTEEWTTRKHWRSYLVPTCQLSPSPPNNPGTPLAVSLRFLPVWPSCSCGSTLKVTLCTRRHCLSLPYHHQSHARTRWLLLSPRSCQQYTVHTITTPTLCCCSKAFTLHWMWKKNWKYSLRTGQGPSN